MGIGDPLTGSAFEMNREMGHGGVLSLWSRGARSQFAGQEGDVSLDGRVATTMAGADYQKGRLMAGLSLAHSRGRGAYQGVSVGDLASSMTGLYTWLGYRMTERVTVWGVTGYGKGSLKVTPEKGAALKTGLSMAMAAAGLRGDLAASAVGGFGLAFKTDALWVATTNAGVEGPAGHLTATRGAVSRFRAGLEASRGYAVGRRLTLEPSLELGLRHDGGAAETGAGLDLGAGLIVFDAGTGLAVDLQMRTLLVHHAEGFSERSVAVSFSFDPTPSTPLGFTAQVAPSWGGEATSGAEALWGRETMAGMAPRGGLATGAGLDAEAGYGLLVGRRFVGTPTLGIGTSEHGRDYRLGYRLGGLGGAGLGVEFHVEAQRQERPQVGGSSIGALAGGTLRW